MNLEVLVESGLFWNCVQRKLDRVGASLVFGKNSTVKVFLGNEQIGSTLNGLPLTLNDLEYILSLNI